MYELLIDCNTPTSINTQIVYIYKDQLCIHANQAINLILSHHFLYFLKIMETRIPENFQFSLRTKILSEFSLFIKIMESIQSILYFFYTCP